jgi:hypothetical protein
VQALRNASFLGRLVLAWFALFIVAAVAGALLQPQSVELLCSGTGAVKLLVKNSSGGGEEQPAAAHTLDCPLCASIVAPLVAQANAPGAAQPQVYASRSNPSPHPATAESGPLPARGPPSVLS